MDCTTVLLCIIHRLPDRKLGALQLEVIYDPAVIKPDIVTTIDLDMQLAAEKYLQSTPSKRGA